MRRRPGRQQNYTLGGRGNAISVAVGDFNGDGEPDLVAGGGSIWILLGNGDGTFQLAVAYSDNGTQSVAVKDVNLDGKPDLILAGGTTVVVMLNNGTGEFRGLTNYGVGGFPESAVVGDFNADGGASTSVPQIAALIEAHGVCGEAGAIVERRCVCGIEGCYDPAS
jgi:hypothetical protein